MARPPAWSTVAALIAPVTLAACGPSGRTLFVPLPELGDVRSLITSARTANTRHLAAVELEAGSGSSGTAIDLPVDELGAIVLSVLGYRETLAELGVPAGAVPMATGTEGFVLPAPAELHFAEVLGGVAGAWDAPEVGDPELFDLRIAGEPPRTTPCAELLQQTLEVDSFENPDLLVRVAPDTAILAMDDERFFSAGPGGVTPLAIDGANTPHESAYLRDPAELWLGGSRGLLSFGDPATHLYDPAPSSPLGLPLARLTGSASDQPLELFAVSSYGSFERFDGARWTTLHPAGESRDYRRDLVMVGPGEALAVGIVESVALRYRSGELTTEVLGESVSAMSVGQIPGVGTVVGAFDGKLLRHDGGRWVPFEDSPIALAITAIVPFRGGFLVTTGAGLLVEWQPGYGFCEPVPTPHAIIKFVAPLESGIMIAGDRKPGSTSSSILTFLTARAPGRGG